MVSCRRDLEALNEVGKGLLTGGFWGRGARGLARVGLTTDGGATVEGSAFLDGEGASGDVANQDGVAFELAAFLDDDVAFDLAEDDNGAGFDFALDVGVFADGECAIGVDFAFDASVDDEVVGELDGTFDFDVVGKYVFSGCHGGRGGALGLLCGGGRRRKGGGVRRQWGPRSGVFCSFVGLTDDLP